MNPYPFLPVPDPVDGLAGFEFTTPEQSVRLTQEGPVAVPLPNLRLTRATGDDRVPFLHNLLSNDVQKLAPGTLQWNSLNSPKGRMIANLLMWQDDEAIMIALAAELHAAVTKKLSMYVLRSKVRLADASPDFALIGVAGPGAPEVLAGAGIEAPAAAMSAHPRGAPRCLRLTGDLFIVLTPAAESSQCWQALQAAGARPAGSAAWDLLQIRSGLPRITPATQEEFVAQMLNYELIGGVSFTKGCYPGQEIVARTQYLGKLKKRMYRARVEGVDRVQPGGDLFAPEFGAQAAGKVVLAAPSPDGGWECLAVLQSSSAETGGITLGSPGGAKVDLLPLPYELT